MHYPELSYAVEALKSFSEKHTHGPYIIEASGFPHLNDEPFCFGPYYAEQMGPFETPEQAEMIALENSYFTGSAYRVLYALGHEMKTVGVKPNEED